MNFIVCLIIAMAWLQPLHILPWVSWHSEVLVFFGLLLAAGIHVLPAALKKKYFLLPMAALLPLSIAFVIFFQLLAGKYFYTGVAIVLIFYALSAVLATIVGGSVHEKENLLKIISTLVLIAATLNVYITVIQSLGLSLISSLINPLPEVRRPGGNLGQANHLGTLLVMGVASIFFLVDRRSISNTLAGVLGLLVVFGIAITESRAAYVSLIGLLLWRLIGPLGKFDRRCLVQMLGVFAIFQTFWFCWPILFNEYWFFDGSGNSGGRYVEGLGVRWVVWGQLLEAVSLKPWFGWGFGRVAAAHNAILHNDMAGEPFSFAHNVVLDFAVGVGVPFTLIVLIVSVIWFCRRIVNINSFEKWYAVAVIIPMGIHSLFEFPFAYAYFLIPGFFFVGILGCNSANLKTIKLSSKFCAFAYVLMAGVALLMVAEYVELEEDFRNARLEALRVGEAVPAIDYSKIIILNQVSALSEATRLQVRPEMSKSDIDKLKNVALIYPWSACQSRYALALALNGELAEAQRQLKVIRAMHGEKTYQLIRSRWVDLSKNQFPALENFAFPPI